MSIDIEHDPKCTYGLSGHEREDECDCGLFDRMEAERKAAHTPGPIEVEERTGGYVLKAASVGPASPEHGHYQTIGSATQRNPHPKHGGGVSMETARANALLWAAAPGMLEALQTTLGNLRSLKGNAFKGLDTIDEWIAVVEGAIAKAGTK